MGPIFPGPTEDSDEDSFESPPASDDHSNGEDGNRGRSGDAAESDLFYRRACILADAVAKHNNLPLELLGGFTSHDVVYGKNVLDNQNVLDVDYSLPNGEDGNLIARFANLVLDDAPTNGETQNLGDLIKENLIDNFRKN